MNLDTLSRIVATETEEPLGIVEAIIKAAFAEIRAAVTAGQPVHIDGFGKFRMKEAGGWAEERPQHGRAVVHPPHRQPMFKASHEWREEVNGDRWEAA